MITKKCKTCNNSFKSYKSDKKKYCSRKCFELRRHPSCCLGCGQEFYVPGEPNQKYCSQKCYSKNIKGTFQKGHKVNKGKNHTLETKEKLSLSHRKHRAKWVKNWIQFPNFNPNGCERILEYGKKHGYNFQTAINGGEYFIKELGYWVDGYDIQQNVVIEYMEKFHQTPKHLKKDKLRRERIIDHLGCKYIEIWE